MKKIIFTIAASFALSFNAAAQGRVTVDYDIAVRDTLTRELMAFLDVYYLKATVHGDIKGKKWLLYSHRCEGDSVVTKPVFPYAFEFSDTTATFTFFAKNDGPDTVRISCNTPRYGGNSVKYAIDTKNETEYPTPYILMETFPEKPYTTADEINLAAYTSGIRTGQSSYSFCDLRYKKSHPATWQKEHKIPRFVFFSLRME